MIAVVLGRVSVRRACANSVVRLVRAGCSSSSSSSQSSSPPSIPTIQEKTNHRSPKRFPRKAAEFEWKSRLGDADLILRKVRLVDNPSDLIQIIDQYNLVMNSKHLVACFESFLRMVRLHHSEPQVIANLPAFEILSAHALKHMGSYEPSELVTLLKAMSRFQIQSSPLVQNICENIQSRLNRLSVQELIFVHFLLERLTHTCKGAEGPIETLKTAIPIVFQDTCYKVDTTNHEATFRALTFAIGTGCNEDTLEHLSSSLKSYCRNISSAKAMDLVLQLRHISHHKDLEERLSSPSVREILQLCLAAILQGLPKLDDTMTPMLVSVLPYLDFSKPFYDALWKKAIEENWNLSQISSLTFASRHHHYFTLESGRYVRDCVLKNQHEILTNTSYAPGVLMHMVALLASHNRYLRATGIEDADDSALTQKAASIIAMAVDFHRMAMTPRRFCRFMGNLATIGVFLKSQLELLFSEEYQEDILATRTASPRLLRNMLTVERRLQLYPEQDSAEFRLIPAVRSEARRAIDRQAVPCRMIEEQLAKALGGSQFLAKEFVTPLGTKVDLLIAMRPGDYPIAVSDDENTNNDLLQALPTNTKVVAIVPTRETDYMHGSGLPGVELLRVEKMCPVVVNVDKWMDLKDFEKIPHIMQDIKAALEVGQMLAELKEDASVM